MTSRISFVGLNLIHKQLESGQPDRFPAGRVAQVLRWEDIPYIATNPSPAPVAPESSLIVKKKKVSNNNNGTPKSQKKKNYTRRQKKKPTE